MREYQVSYRGNRLVTKDNIINVLNELGYDPGEGDGVGGYIKLNRIVSWYLLTNKDSDVTRPQTQEELQEQHWKSYFVKPTSDKPYVWKFSDYQYVNSNDTSHILFRVYTDCEIVSIYYPSGEGMGTEFVYSLFDKDVTSVVLKPGNNNGSLPETIPEGNWTDNLDQLDYTSDGYLWMSSRKTSGNRTWSKPIRLSGEDGSPGADGDNIEFIYKLSGRKPVNPGDKPIDNDKTEDNYIPSNPVGWDDHPHGVEEGERRFEWMCYRTKEDDPVLKWSDWSDVVIWSSYGEKGMDGDGVEYVYMNSHTPTVSTPNPRTPDGPKFSYNNSQSTTSWSGDVVEISQNVWRPKGWDEGLFSEWLGGKYNPQGEWIPKIDPNGSDNANNFWSDSPQGVDDNHLREWVSLRKKINGVWGSFSSPSIWAVKHSISIEKVNGKWVWVIDGEITEIVAEGQDGRGINLKGRVDFYEEQEKLDYIKEHPGLTEEQINNLRSLEFAEDTFELTNADIGSCFVVNSNGHIYLYLGPDDNNDWEDNWHNFGEFQGEGAYVHIAWATNVTRDPVDQHLVVENFRLDRETNGSIIEFAWMGICTNNEQLDPDFTRASEYKWNYVRGKDGNTYERVYIRTTQKDIVPTIKRTIDLNTEKYVYESYIDATYPDPPGHTYDKPEYLPFVGNGASCGAENIGGSTPGTEIYQFSDDPKGVNNVLRYEWRSERKKVDGVWQDFGEVTLESNYAQDGQGVIRSTVFKKSVNKPSTPSDAEGSYSVPRPSGWSDGLPTEGTGSIWMTSRIFTSNQQPPQGSWSEPMLLQDSETLDIELSPQSKNASPLIYPIDIGEQGANRHDPNEESGYEGQLWFDPEQDANYIANHATEFNWMATRSRYINPVSGAPAWRNWVVVLIKGAAGKSFEHAYLSFPVSLGTPTLVSNSTGVNVAPTTAAINNSGPWTWTLNSTTNITVNSNEALWMTERWAQDTIRGDWSAPVKISGEGTPGEDAEDIEFIYKRSSHLPDNSSESLDRPGTADYNNKTYDQDGYVPEGWTNNPQGVDNSPEHKYEWMCQRIKPRTNSIADPEHPWGPWSNIFVWSAYGDTGMDGDGIEYVYTRVSNPTKPKRPRIVVTNGDTNYENGVNWNGGVVNTGTSQSPVWEPKDYSEDFYGWIGGEYNPQGEWVPEGWTDDPQGVGTFPNPNYDSSNPNSKENIIYYREYVSQRKRINGIWGDFSDPSAWSIKPQHFHIENGKWVDEEGNSYGDAEGPQGQGIQLKGTVDVYSRNDKNGDNTLTALEDITPQSVSDLTVGDCYVVRASRYLYVSVYDGETWDSLDWTKNWDSIGEFQGQPGEDGVSSYMHIAWALAENVLFDQSGEHIFDITDFETWSEHLDSELDYEWMGVCTDDNINDPENWQDYKWNHVRGKDGDNYERVYIKTKTGSTPGLDQNSYDDPNGDKTKDEFLPLVLYYDSSIQGNDNPYSNYRFTDDPSGVTANYPYEWVAERKKKLDSTTNIVRWFEFSEPSLWAKYSFDGSAGKSIQVKYCSFPKNVTPTLDNNTKTSPNPTSGNGTKIWSNTVTGLTINSENFLWMIQRVTNDPENDILTTWSDPIRLSGENGEPGTDGTDGVNGTRIEFIYKVSNNISETKPGKDLNDGKTYASDDYVPEGWTDNPSGVSLQNKYEWACQRIKSGNESWSDPTNDWIGPFIWSAYGDTGMDGDGVEYVYFRRADAPATPIGPRARKKNNNNEKLPWYGGVEDIGNSQTHVWVPKNWDATTNGAWSDWEWDSDAGYYNNSQGEWIPKAYNVNGTAITNGSGGYVYWSDDPSGVTKNDGERIEWVSTRRRVNGVWSDFTSPKLWASFGSHVTIDQDGRWVIDGTTYGKAEGEDGKGVSLKGSVDVILNKDKNSTYTTSLQEINPYLSQNLYSNIQPGDCYVVRYPDLSNLGTPGHLFVALHDKDGWVRTNEESPSWDFNVNWDDIGEFQGAPGEDGVSSYMHIAWAESGNIVWDPQVPNKIQNIKGIIKAYEDKTIGITYDWMGICTNHNEDDPDSWSEYKWNHVKGKDGVDFERVYSRTNSFSVVPVVNQNTYETGTPGKDKTLNEFYPQISNYVANGPIEFNIFTDDPRGSTPDWPYEWYTERRKEFDNNTLSMVWRNFGPVKLWTNYSSDGFTAYLTKGSDSVTVDAAGNVVGGYGNNNTRISTEVKIYDPKKSNGNGTYGGYLEYTSSSNIGINQFGLTIIGTDCTANITNTGKIYAYPVDVTKSSCSISIIATLSTGKTFNFNFPVTLSHIPQTYLTYTLTNDSDVFTYRTRNQQYDGLPIETRLEVQTTDGTIDSLGDNTLKENGYIKSVTVVGKGNTNLLRYAKVDGNNVVNKTITVATNTTNSTTITHVTKTAIIYTDSSQDTGLRLEIKSDGNIKLYRTGTTDLDLEDTKHDLDISCIAVLGGVEYNSPVKTFSLSEKNDITLYKLVLSNDTFIKDETGNYNPAENAFNVKVNISDETGTTTVTPDSNSGLVRGNVKVMFINGAPATTPGSDTLSLLSSLDFSSINNNFFTVVVVEYDSSSQPTLYHDAETVNIILPGISQSYIDLSPTQFIVDCNSSGNVVSTRNLDFTAWLKWGNITLNSSQLVAGSCTINQTMGGNYTSPNSLTIASSGEVSGRYTFTENLPLTSGEITLILVGSIGGNTITEHATISVIAQKQGNSGNNGQRGRFTSIVFLRTNDEIGGGDYIPEGGTYTSPFPDDGYVGNNENEVFWEDSIPEGDEMLWSSSCVFYGNGDSNSGWTIPRKMSDTDTYDVEFALKQSNGNTPAPPSNTNRHDPENPSNSSTAGPNQIWFDPELDRYYINAHSEDFYWRAEREINNGVEGPWVISQIKGESEPSIQAVPDIFVIETDPTGKLSQDQDISFTTKLFSGNQIQTPTIDSGTKIEYVGFVSGTTSTTTILSTGASFDSTTNAITWTITIPEDQTLQDSSIKVTMKNSYCSDTTNIPVTIKRLNRSSFKSFVFKRFANTPSASDAPSTTATGGSYENNGLPTGTSGRDSGWSDGLPNDGGTNPIYMSSRTFYSDGQPDNDSWSTPVKMSDTDIFDVEFSFVDSNPGKPGDSGKTWYDPSGNPPSGKTWADAVWMATNTKNSSGSWSGWVVVRIKGEKGDTGNGITSTTPWYKISPLYEGVTPPSTSTILPYDGWDDVYIKPTRENPYLWKFTRTIFTNGDISQTDPELIQVWSENMINPNLLDDTEFFDNDHMNAWNISITNPYYSPANVGTTYLDYINGGTTYYYEERRYKQYYIQHKAKSGVSNTGSICYLSQRLYYESNGIEKIIPDTWYTFSFKAFAFSRGDSTLVNAPSGLIVELSNIAVSGGTITWTNQLGKDTPIVTENTNRSYTIDFSYDANHKEHWTTFSATFKTPSGTYDSSTNLRVEFKIRPKTYEQYIFITEPKVELGKIATEYVPGSTIRSPYPRTSAWEAGKQYYQGVYGEPYLDIVTFGGNWFRCRQTHISKETYTSGGTTHQGNEPIINTTTVYWEPAKNLNFIATDLVLAETALINNLVASSVRTGERGVIPHVEMSGSRIEFYGTGMNPSIRFNVDTSGAGILEFLDNDGNVLYNLGPNGITRLIDARDSTYADSALYQINSSTYVGDLIKVVQNNVIIPSITGDSFNIKNKYTLTEGYQKINNIIKYRISDGSSPSAFNGRIFDDIKPSDSDLKNFLTSNDIEDYTNFFDDNDNWYITSNYGPRLDLTTEGGSTYRMTFHKYRGGRLSETISIYFYESDARNYWSSSNTHQLYGYRMINGVEHSNLKVLTLLNL